MDLFGCPIPQGLFSTKSARFEQKFGRENTIRNSIFAFGQEFQVMRNRIYWDERGIEIRPAGKSWEEWRKSGTDAGAKVTDPLFVNAGRAYRPVPRVRQYNLAGSS
jgi:hypothetical protein